MLLLATQRWHRRLAGAGLLLLQHHLLLLMFSRYTSKRPCEPAPVSACVEVWSQTAVTKHSHRYAHDDVQKLITRNPAGM